MVRWSVLALSEITKTCGLWFSTMNHTPLTFFFPFRQNWPMAQDRAWANYLSSSPLKEYGERPARRKVPMNAMTREQETIYETHCTQDKLAGKGSSLPRRL
jgi:hypothetical protein